MQKVQILLDSNSNNNNCNCNLIEVLGFIEFTVVKVIELKLQHNRVLSMLFVGKKKTLLQTKNT